ncbi:MAG: beta strand repeat-containing protein [Erythrobacter sp.]
MAAASAGLVRCAACRRGPSGNETSELRGAISLASDATISVVDRMGLIFTGPGIQGTGTQVLTFASDGTGNSTIRALSAISNIAGLIKNGPGLLELNAVNSFTGPFTINGGDVNMLGGSALADSVAVSMAAGTRLGVGTSETIGSLAGTGGVLLAANELVTGGNNASTSFAGVISGINGRLTKNGTGTFTLTGANTYTGVTRINAGTLTASNRDALGSTDAGTIVADGATLVLRSVGGISFASEALTLSGAGVGGLGALRSFNQTGRNVHNAPIILADDALIAGDEGQLVLFGGITGEGRTLTFTGSGNNLLGGVIATGTGGLVKEGGGTLSLSGVNTYTGLTTINSGQLTNLGTIAGDVLTRAGFTNLGTVLGNVAVAAGATSSPGRIAGNVTIEASGVFSSRGTIDGDVTSSGSANLSGTLGGTLTILAGQTGIGGALTVAGAVDMRDGASLNLIEADLAISSLTGAGTVRLGGTIPRSLTIGSDNTSTTFAGSFLNAGGLTKTGSGTFTLTNENLYTGTTTISGGALQIGNGGTTGTLGSGNVVNNAALVFNRSNDLTVANAISGTGTIVQAGGGTTVLSGLSDGFAGSTSVTGGRLLVTGTLGGGVTVNGGLLGGTGTLAGPVVINAGGTLAAGRSPGILTIGDDLTLNAWLCHGV